ncbi:MAG: hypothetical protein K2N78_08330 [Oscillospiraceae bacterium]|nr:hypothetical protein [Oscillospiraceae bacterium]
MMKKISAVLLTLALLLSLTACGDALSKLKDLTDKDKGKSDTVQAKEPDIPGTAAPSTDDPPPAEYDPTAPVESSGVDGPGASAPEPDAAPTGGEENKPAASTGVTASHKDVSLFSAGEAFTMSAQGVSGIYASSFTSKNPEVASVDAISGKITAVSPGMTTVTMHVECEAGQFDFDCIVRCRWEAELPTGETGPDAAQQPSVPTQNPSSSASLSSFFSTLQGKYDGLSNMTVLDGQLLDSYYPGLTGIAAVEEVVIRETSMSTANMAVGLVKLSDSATVDDILAVQSVLQSRITTQANGGAYYPESCETWENGVITSVSNCVGMFVYPDGAHAMANLFTDTFSN